MYRESEHLMKLHNWLGTIILVSVLLVFCLFEVAMAQEKVNIKYSFWGNPASIGVEEDIIKEFTKVHPEIQVDTVVVPYPDYHPKIMTMIAGGQSPDVMRIDTQFLANFIKAEAIKPLNDLVQQDKINLDLYYKGGLLENTHDGKLYGLPWGTAPVYLIYNIKMFNDAGVEIPQVGWKWEDFVEAATSIAGGEGTEHRYGYGHNEFNLFTGIIPFVWTTGGDVFDETRSKFTMDDPRVLSRLDEMARLIEYGAFANPFEMTSTDVVTRWFANNRIAMRLGSAIDVLSIQAIEGVDFDVTHFPCGENVLQTTIVKSNAMSISAVTEHSEEAWAFLKFLREPGGVGDILYSKSKRVPPAANIPELWDLYADPTKPPKSIREITDLISSTYGRTLPIRPGWTEIQGILGPALEKIWAGQLNAEEAIKEVKPRIEEVLLREGL